jgi:glycine cleavage system aminomethyltransferase T
MTPTSRPLSAGPLPETCLAAGAVLAERDGRTIIANYGSVPGEIAVCMKSVGLVDRTDLDAFEIRAETARLERALEERLGDPPIAPGSARRLRDVWYLRLDRRRALVVGPHTALASGSPILTGAENEDWSAKDITRRVAIISVIGPRAARLLGAAALPERLLIGAVARDPQDPKIVAILRESQRRILIVVKADGADALWVRLLVAGEPLGAAFVGSDALSLLGAASLRV